MQANAYTQKISNFKNNNKTKRNLFLNNSLGYILFSHPLKTKANLHAKVMYIILVYLQKGWNLPWIFDIQDVMSSDLYFLFCFYSKDKVSLCISGWAGIYYVDRAGLKLNELCLSLSASASWVLLLKQYITTHKSLQLFKELINILITIHTKSTTLCK